MKDRNYIITILADAVPTWAIAILFICGTWNVYLKQDINLITAIFFSILIPVIAYFLTIPKLRAILSSRKKDKEDASNTVHQHKEPQDNSDSGQTQETTTDDIIPSKQETPEERRAWLYNLNQKRLKGETKEEEIQKPGTYDPMLIQHMVKRLQEMNGREKLLFFPFQDLCMRANKEYERVSKDLAMAITNHYLQSHDYPTPEKLAEQTGISIHYCYQMLQTYRKQMGERLAKFTGQKDATAHDILYKSHTIYEQVSTGKIIGYKEVPYTSCRTLMEESCYMNTGGHYEYKKEPIYEYKTVPRNVDEYQLVFIPTFVPIGFTEKVKNRWNDLSIEAELDFNLLELYISIIYPQHS